MRSRNEPVHCLLFVVLLARAASLSLCLSVYLYVSELESVSQALSVSLSGAHPVSLTSLPDRIPSL